MTRKRFDSAPVINVKDEGLLIQQVSGSTTNLFEIKDSSNNTLFYLDYSGNVTTSASSTAAYLSATTGASFPSNTVITGDFAIDGAVYTTGSPTTLTTNSATTVASFPAATYRSGEFLIQVTQSTKYTVSKVMVLHDGTTAYINEFGILEIGSPRIPLTISASISGGNVLIQSTVTDAASTNATVKVYETLIKV